LFFFSFVASSSLFIFALLRTSRAPLIECSSAQYKNRAREKEEKNNLSPLHFFSCCRCYHPVEAMRDDSMGW